MKELKNVIFFTQRMAIIGQIESYAKANEISLETGWKVELAKEVKSRLLKAGHAAIPSDLLDIWKQIFDDMLTTNSRNSVPSK